MTSDFGRETPLLNCKSHRVFHSNFDFEHELAGDITSARSPLLAQINRDLDSCWRAIRQPRDFVLSEWELNHRRIRSELQKSNLATERPANEGELIPWGWTRSAIELAEKYQLKYRSPPLDVVQCVNSRRYRWEIEQQLGIGLPGSCLLREEQDLLEAIQHFSEGENWGVKAEFGMSGRERILGRGCKVAIQQIQWAKKRWGKGQTLVFEPWLERVEERGLQFEIPVNAPVNAPVQFVGITQLMTDHTGTYRGSRLDQSLDQPDWESAIEMGKRVAEIVQRTGYFGPLGIDAMQYRSRDGTLQIRFLQDLNGRMTMGRLALGWLSQLQPGEYGSWLHFRSGGVEQGYDSLPSGDQEVTNLSQHQDWPPDARILDYFRNQQGQLRWVVIGAGSARAQKEAEDLTSRLIYESAKRS